MSSPNIGNNSKSTYDFVMSGLGKIGTSIYHAPSSVGRFVGVTVTAVKSGMSNFIGTIGTMFFRYEHNKSSQCQQTIIPDGNQEQSNILKEGDFLQVSNTGEGQIVSSFQEKTNNNIQAVQKQLQTSKNSSNINSLKLNIRERINKLEPQLAEKIKSLQENIERIKAINSRTIQEYNKSRPYSEPYIAPNSQTGTQESLGATKGSKIFLNTREMLDNNQTKDQETLDGLKTQLEKIESYQEEISKIKALTNNQNDIDNHDIDNLQKMLKESLSKLKLIDQKIKDQERKDQERKKTQNRKATWF